ncbi:hypothetical protein M3P05_00950 [Sansalvadorimonas sp. 2012CJ34-2]|uniref:Uncharacterized protein n=1 Tax=Parendozoicomonas callyspongiae TaxID=2942213 RepID=A0ABT0PAW1_9GAMM|nr:tight adherence pilus pseudopilin TadF [Sansalvadorimonas sp. 2012CJ34-2]MCL6268519.1 hypothetical protein [Sansalvadorimonas sp. 2012CJ34-2]
MAIKQLISFGKHAQPSWQKGVFSVELALAGVFIAMILAFISDMVSKQTLQGHLQRLSYSAVNVVKERTQLYNESDQVDDNQVNTLFNIISNSMGRSMSGFDRQRLAMHLEQLRFIRNGNGSFDQDPVSFKRGTLECEPAHRLSTQPKLHIETSWGRMATLYQVTLCYRGDNWFGNALGDGSDYSRVAASSLMLGR